MSRLLRVAYLDLLEEHEEEVEVVTLELFGIREAKTVSDATTFEAREVGAFSMNFLQIRSL